MNKPLHNKFLSGSMECENNKGHPTDPRSNVANVGLYDPNKYAVHDVSSTVRTHEALTPNRPPCLTQDSIGKFLVPITRELDESSPCPTIAEFPDTVIDNMVKRDKAFWVDKPGANAYVLHDAFYQYGMTSEKLLPPHQDVFPRSYQYDLDCVQYRRRHACDGLKETGDKKKPISAHCRNCQQMNVPGLTPFQLAWAQDPGQKRWRNYPDLTTKMTKAEIQELMADLRVQYNNAFRMLLGLPWRCSASQMFAETHADGFHAIMRKKAASLLQRLRNSSNSILKMIAARPDCPIQRHWVKLALGLKKVGRPFQSEACNWYNKNYPSMKYDVIVRKFSK